MMEIPRTPMPAPTPANFPSAATVLVKAMKNVTTVYAIPLRSRTLAVTIASSPPAAMALWTQASSAMAVKIAAMNARRLPQPLAA